jgi:hypothetical protein
MEESILTGKKKQSMEKWAKSTGVDMDLARSLETAVREPSEAPYLIERIRIMFQKIGHLQMEEVRNALLRVQIYCSINSDTDPILVSKQLFIAEVLEKLLFGNNLLMMDEIEEPMEHLKKKSRRKKKS